MNSATGLLILIALGGLGALLFARGWGGIRRGHAPHCQSCGFDLTGLWGETRGAGEPAARCPECGSDLRARHAVVQGEVRRRPRTMVAGIALVLLTLGVASTAFLRVSVNWMALKPTWMLLQQVESQDYWSAAPAAVELARRHQNSGLSDHQLQRIFDACLSQQKRQPGIWDSQVWPPLMEAAYAAGVVDEPRRDRHLYQLLGWVQRTFQTEREIYLAGEPFPSPLSRPQPGIELTPAITFNPTWATPNQGFGVAAYLECVTLDGRPLPLISEEFASGGDSSRHGHFGRWMRYGSAAGSSFVVYPKDFPLLVPTNPPVGAHDLNITWRMEVYDLQPSERGTAPLGREPDFVFAVSHMHQIEVVSSIEDVTIIVHSDGPNAQPPPRYLGPNEGLTLRVTEARKLHRDGDWYYRIAGHLTRQTPSPDTHYAFLGRIRLEVDGKVYEVAEFEGITDLFYDRTTAPAVDQSRGDPARTSFDLNIIDLPRVDRVDIVILPEPDLALKDPGLPPGHLLGRAGRHP